MKKLFWLIILAVLMPFTGYAYTVGAPPTMLPPAYSSYAPNSAAADQGVTSTAYVTLKNLVDAIGATDQATIILSHSGATAQTTYTLTTNESVPANQKLYFENGAIIDGAGTLTLDSPDQIMANPGQQIFGTSITISFTNAGIDYPEWWGAKGDNSTDCTTAIQAAIDALPPFSGTDDPPFQGVDCGGGTKLSHGAYIVSSSLALKSHQRLYGIGRSSILVNAGSGTPVITMGYDGNYSFGMYVGHLSIQGDATAYAAGEYGIHVKRGFRSVIEDVCIQDCGDDGIYLQGASYFYIIGGSYISYNYGHGIYAKHSAAAGWHLTATWIKNNTVRLNVKPGIKLEDVPDAHVVGNTIESNGSTGQNIGNVGYLNGTDLNINLYLDHCTGVRLIDNHFEQSAAWSDIIVQIAQAGGYSNRISGNGFHNYIGLYLYSDDSTVAYNTYENNLFAVTTAGNVYTYFFAGETYPNNNRFLNNDGMRWTDSGGFYAGNVVFTHGYSDSLKMKLRTVSGGATFTPSYELLSAGAMATDGETKGSLYEITLNQNIAIITPTLVPPTGTQIVFRFIQDATGGRTVSWQAAYKQAWSDAGNAAGKTSTIVFRYMSGNVFYQIGAQSPYY